MFPTLDGEADISEMFHSQNVEFHEVMENAEFFRMTSKNYIDVSIEPPYAILRKVKWKDDS